MSYKRADEILPENILEILKTYVSGEAIYVPKKKECRRRRNFGSEMNRFLTSTRRAFPRKNWRISII